MFQSDRTFRVWHAVVGHGQLLLRSTKTDSERTRIDILFKPVQAMKLRMRLPGLVVREASSPESETIAREAGETERGDFKTFVIESNGFRGYVVASVMATAEDEGEYSDPSQLLVD